jgi:hypothetical protein
MWMINMDNNVEENNSSGDTSGEPFQSNGTSGGSYQQTGQNGSNPPTRSRTIILIKAMLMLIDER